MPPNHFHIFTKYGMISRVLGSGRHRCFVTKESSSSSAAADVEKISNADDSSNYQSQRHIIVHSPSPLFQHLYDILPTKHLNTIRDSPEQHSTLHFTILDQLANHDEQSPALHFPTKTTLSILHSVSQQQKIIILAKILAKSQCLYPSSKEKTALMHLMGLEGLHKDMENMMNLAREFIRSKGDVTHVEQVELDFSDNTRQNVLQNGSTDDTTKHEISDSAVIMALTILQQNDNKLPNARQISELMHETNLSRTQVYSLFYRLSDKQHRGRITQLKKDRILEWTREHGTVFPTQEQMKELCKELNLSPLQLLNQLRVLRAPSPGKIDKRVKYTIKKWLAQHKRLPNTEERITIAKELNINASQLRTQLWMLKDQNKEMTQEKKDLVKEWLRERKAAVPGGAHEGFVYKASNRDIRELIQHSGLGRKQVQYLLRTMQEKRTPVTPEKKAIIQSYMEKLGRYPLRDERKELLTLTQLSPTQLSDVMKKMKVKRGVATEETKDIIRQWLKENDNRSPNTEERTELMKRTGLNRSQIAYHIQYQREKHGEITFEVKLSIEQWLEREWKWANPPIEQRREMSKRLGISVIQLQNQIRLIQNRHAKQNHEAS